MGFDTGNNLDIATAFSAILVCSKDGFWPIPPIQSSQIVGYQIAALRHIADGRPAVSPIGANGHEQTRQITSLQQHQENSNPHQAQTALEHISATRNNFLLPEEVSSYIFHLHRHRDRL